MLGSSAGVNMLNSAIDSINRGIYDQATTKCWGTMAKLRGSSLCSTCAGNSETYFNHDKGLVDINTCSTVLESCNQSFDIIFKFFVGIEPILELLEKMGQEGKETSHHHSVLHKLVVKIREEVKKITENDIHQGIMQYGNSPGPAKDKLGANLCGKLLILAHKTFIEILATQCEQIKPELDFLKSAIVGSYLNNIHTTKQERKSERNSNFADQKKKINARILFDPSHFHLTLEPFLQGDVQVVQKVDSAYSSVFGSIGSSGNENSMFIHKHPMNLTKAFP